MSPEDIYYAEQCVHEGVTPPDSFIHTFFPVPFRWLEKYNMSSTADTMRYYWRHRHSSPTEDTPVVVCTIEHEVRMGLQYEGHVVDEPEKKLTILNPAFLVHVQPGDTAYVHAARQPIANNDEPGVPAILAERA
jgi:hypothetical protein